jgi:hypothetical protein
MGKKKRKQHESLPDAPQQTEAQQKKPRGFGSGVVIGTLVAIPLAGLLAYVFSPPDHAQKPYQGQEVRIPQPTKRIHPYDLPYPGIDLQVLAAAEPGKASGVQISLDARVRDRLSEKYRAVIALIPGQDHIADLPVQNPMFSGATMNFEPPVSLDALAGDAYLVIGIDRHGIREILLRASLKQAK